MIWQGHIYLVLPTQLKVIWWRVKDREKISINVICNLREGITRVTHFENTAFWAKVSIYLEVWCSSSLLQSFVCGGFWLADVWHSKLEGKTERFSSHVSMLPKKKIRKTCKNSQETCFPSNCSVLSTGVFLQSVCCIWVGHFITIMSFTSHKIKFLAPSKFLLVKSFAFSLKLLTCFECRVPCVWLHYSIRHREGRSRDIMGQQIGQRGSRSVIACSWLLWKQWRSRSSWSAEEMRRNISVGALLALPVLGCPASPGEGRPAQRLLWGSSLLLSGYHLLPLPSTGILLQSAALLHVLVLTGAAMMLRGLGAGQPWKINLALSVLPEESKQHRKHQSVD